MQEYWSDYMKETALFNDLMIKLVDTEIQKQIIDGLTRGLSNDEILDIILAKKGDEEK
jgi:hypothetical protein